MRPLPMTASRDRASGAVPVPAVAAVLGRSRRQACAVRGSRGDVSDHERLLRGFHVRGIWAPWPAMCKTLVATAQSKRHCLPCSGNIKSAHSGRAEQLTTGRNQRGNCGVRGGGGGATESHKGKVLSTQMHGFKFLCRFFLLYVRNHTEQPRKKLGSDASLTTSCVTAFEKKQQQCGGHHMPTARYFLVHDRSGRMADQIWRRGIRPLQDAGRGQGVRHRGGKKAWPATAKTPKCV